MKKIKDLLNEYLDKVAPLEMPLNSIWKDNEAGRDLYDNFISHKRKEITPIFLAGVKAAENLYGETEDILNRWV